jgi:glycosyltransferase involved in cell wall biosynthesis
MKVLILGSVALPIPPAMQGGTERMAYYQAKGLVARGHDVTMIVAKGSSTTEGYTAVQIGGGDTVDGSKVIDKTLLSAKKEVFTESSRNLRKEAVYLSQVSTYLLQHGREYDIIINNMRAGESIFMPIVSSLGKTMLNVMHLPLFSELADEFRKSNQPIVTISNAQRKEFPDLNYVGTVYNCVDTNVFTMDSSQSNRPPSTVNREPYLLMMGSIAPHKNQKTGIDVAKSVGIPIVLAGKISNPTYYSTVIAPLVDGKSVRHVGEIGLEKKIALYQGAKALLFPVLWEEPFGLVMIEALSCGTPVVAFDRGSVSEIVRDGKTGYIVDTVVQMIEAAKKLGSIDRARCRKDMEASFTVDRMIDSLEKILETSIS